MWESPIEAIQTEIRTEFEDNCLKAVQSYGFLINKEELVKALNYDRNQYEKGYSDGYAEAINDFVERLKEEYKPFEGASEYDKMECAMVYRRFDKIAHELKGESDE